jgi:SAM-dependent methyltransferase
MKIQIVTDKNAVAKSPPRFSMAPMPSEPTERFSDRVDDYVKYRPSYPTELLDVLAAHAGLSADATAADIGAGTGISTRLLLESGACVIAVEPNGPMRQALHSELDDRQRLSIVDGTAEATSIPAESVDLITCFQSFHWFAPAPTRAEFSRILRSTGYVALIWNDRRNDGSPFMADYDRLLASLPAGNRSDGHQKVVVDGRIEAFFQPLPVRCDRLKNSQRLDFPSLAGRLRSSSYTPTPEQPEYVPMMTALREIFNRHEQSGFVEMLYQTEIYTGRLGG